MLETIISGGQTGADQAGWRAAKRFGLKTGGWMPRGYRTEDGPRPEFAAMYGAKEHQSREYPPRTMANVSISEGTIFFGSQGSSGFGATYWGCAELQREFFHISGPLVYPHEFIANLIGRWDFKAINIAGNREIRSPGIGYWVEEYLCEVFRLLGLEESRCEENECGTASDHRSQ